MIGQGFRAQAAQLREAVAPLLAATDTGVMKLSALLAIDNIDELKRELGAYIDAKPTHSELMRHTAAIAGSVEAGVLETLADVFDTLFASGSLQIKNDKMRAAIERNNAMRVAALQGAASGDYSRFDELVAGLEASGVGEATGA